MNLLISDLSSVSKVVWGGIWVIAGFSLVKGLTKLSIFSTTSKMAFLRQNCGDLYHSAKTHQTLGGTG